MNSHQTYFITGVSGYIGGSVAAKLLQGGARVRGLVRKPASAALLAERGVEPVMGELDDTDLLMHEARQSDGVINAASADHAESVKALIAGLKGSAKPLIHTSGSSIVGDDARGAFASDVISDEGSALVVQPFKQARHAIDQMVLQAATSGVRSMVICPSLIYGLGQGLNTQSVQIPFLVENARKHGAVQIVGEGHNIWSNVHIDDVVDLYALALAKAQAGSFFFAANGEASFLELGKAIAKRLELPEIESLAPDVAVEQWGIARALYSFGSNSRVRSVRARQALGWAPRHASVIDWILHEMPLNGDSV